MLPLSLRGLVSVTTIVIPTVGVKTSDRRFTGAPPGVA
jgi:hypothetical protein